MASLVQSADVYIGSKIKIEADSVEFENGRNIGGLPTLYDVNGQYVEPVNQWFIYLSAVKRLENLSSYSRAMLRYWNFLEKHSDLNWDHFSLVKSLKPTYRFRNQELITAIKIGELAYSTANTYMSHVVQFYLWAARENYYQITENHKPFEIEFARIKSDSMFAHMMPELAVQTSDLRIRVPRSTDNAHIQSLTPLSRNELQILSSRLKQSSPEMRLICLLGAQCGLRIEEATRLTLPALNQAIPTNEIQDNFHITIGPSNGVPTKYSKTRTIEISNKLLKSLKRYAIDERRMRRLDKLLTKIELHRSLFSSIGRPLKHSLGLTKEKLDLLIAADHYEPLFISQQGNPLAPKTVNARWGELRNIIKTTEMRFPFKFHDLRCSYGTYRLHSLLEAGLEPSEALDLLMGWMGHRNESTTWRYLRYLKRKEALKDKISILDNIMHQALEEAGIE